MEEKTKRTIIFLGYVVIGASICTIIDSLMGIDFKDVSGVVHFIHKNIWIVHGGIIGLLATRIV